jgi:hypothetical protein
LRDAEDSIGLLRAAAKYEIEELEVLGIYYWKNHL